MVKSKEFGQLVRSYRKHMSLSQKELARMAGYDYTSPISQTEKGQQHIDWIIERLSIAFGLSGKSLENFYSTAGLNVPSESPYLVTLDNYDSHKNGLQALIVRNFGEYFLQRRLNRIGEEFHPREDELHEAIPVNATAIGRPYIISVSPQEKKVSSYLQWENRNKAVQHAALEILLKHYKIHNLNKKAYTFSTPVNNEDQELVAIQFYNTFPLASFIPLTLNNR